MASRNVAYACICSITHNRCVSCCCGSFRVDLCDSQVDTEGRSEDGDPFGPRCTLVRCCWSSRDLHRRGGGLHQGHHSAQALIPVNPYLATKQMEKSHVPWQHCNQRF